MMTYTICTCRDCGAQFATYYRACASVIRVHRVRDLENPVAESSPEAALMCTICARPLDVTWPCAVRTQDGDWLALDVRQLAWAHAN